jgi:hypothetical protein
MASTSTSPTAERQVIISNVSSSALAARPAMAMEENDRIAPIIHSAAKPGSRLGGPRRRLCRLDPSSWSLRRLPAAPDHRLHALRRLNTDFDGEIKHRSEGLAGAAFDEDGQGAAEGR